MPSSASAAAVRFASSNVAPPTKRPSAAAPTNAAAAGDVVAMAIIAELIKDFGMRVGTVGGRFDQLLNECHGRSWLSLEACAVLIGTESISLVDAGAPTRPSPDSSTLYVPCRPIVSRLRSALTANEAELAQGHLQFPPTAIGSQTERRGRRA